MKRERKAFRLGVAVWKHRHYYLRLLPAMAFFIIFCYGPMYGVIIAFKEFNPLLGILKSPWCDPWYKNFTLAFESELFLRALKNTLIISAMKLFLAFPLPIIFAVLIDELPGRKFKKSIQTVSYLPYFISWVIVAGILRNILSTNGGALNTVIVALGGKAVNFFGSKTRFRWLIWFSYIWKSIGYSSVVYLAAISGIDQEQYEAARIDGANRFQLITHVTIPSILPVISILLILNLGSVLSAGFDQIFNMYSPTVYETADILDTYVYRVGLLNQQYSYSAAVGLFKNIIGLLLVLGSNLIVKHVDSDNALF